MSDVPWKWYDGLIGVLFLSPWRLLLMLPRPWLAEVARLPHWALWVGIYLIPVAWRLVFPLWLARRRQPAFRIAVPGVRVWLREGAIALGILAVVWGMILAVVLAASQTSGNGSMPSNVWNSPAANWSSTAILLLSSMTVAPVTEEIFFRGLVFNWLKRFLHPLAAVVLQAVVFALLHPFDVFHLAVVFVLGLALAALYQWRKTLLAPILLHAMQNVVASAAVGVLAGK